MEKDKKSKTSKSRRETAVQGTNDSSIVSKCSMAAQGYFDDPYLQGFVSKVTRRAPLIHRGYYIRAKTIDYILTKFLENNQTEKQIISLGAGFDSAYFRLKAQNLLQTTVFFEVDFPEVVKRKRALIDSNPEMSSMVGKKCSELVEKSPLIEMSTSSYKLVGVDLSQTNTLEAALKLCDIDFDRTTLLMSECVLTYMTRRTASGVVRWASETFGNSVFVLYEQINPSDAFGLFIHSTYSADFLAKWLSHAFVGKRSQIWNLTGFCRMVKVHVFLSAWCLDLGRQNHFQTVGSPLKCINSFPTIQSQKDRFLKLGWTELEVMDMNEFYNNLLSEEEHNRVEKLELFDEYEEWHLKCAHYMILLGYHGDCEKLLKTMLPKKDETVKAVKEYDGMIKLSYPDKQPVRRFGHATSMLGTRHAVCVGGFGEQAGKHMRVTDIILVDTETMDTKILNPNVDNRKVEVSRMHATLSCLEDGRLILIGGRLSPMRLCTQIVSIELNSGKFSWSAVQENMNSDKSNVCMNCGNSEVRSDKKCEHFSESMNSLKKSYSESKENVINEKNLCMNCSRMNISSLKKSVMNSSCEDDVKSENKENVVKCDNGSRNVQVSSECVLNEKNVGTDGCDTDGKSTLDTSTQDQCEVEAEVNISVIEQNGDIPSFRWRHSAVIFNERGTQTIFIYGGRSQNVLAHGDCYKFTPQTQTWQKIDVMGVQPEPRQSHSACFWNEHMVIAGGLGANLQPLNSVHLLNLETYTWSKVQCEINPRYSHTAHVLGDVLVLIGGVCFSHDPPAVAMIHLPSCTSAEFALPAVEKDNLLMLHRHSSVAIGNDKILLLGGGGNCFSFGTHLNSSPIVMDLSEGLNTLKQKVECSKRSD